MGLLAIDGLVSGLQTGDLINQLMRVEAMPQALLSQKQNTAKAFVSALQGLNTKVASLGDVAKKAATTASWGAVTATSTTASVTAKAGALAGSTSLTFTVDKVAQSQISVVDVPATFEGDPPSFTIMRNGEATTITAASASMSDVVKAFNDSDAGVNAVAVRVAGGYKIQFTGTETGEANSFDIVQGADATGTPWASAAGASRGAQDAQITLFAGTSSATPLTSASNTFTALFEGVDVTISKVEADPVTIKVAKDDDALKTLASDLVSQLGLVLGEIGSLTASKTTTGDDGTMKVVGGILSGDSAIRGLQQQILSAVSMPIDGVSPSEVGIVIGRDGTFTFDDKKFAEAMAADPVRTQRIVSGVAQNVQTLAESTSDKYTGSLTTKVTSQETAITNMGDQISAMDRRLALKRQGLERTYSALEVTLSKLQSQSSWLSSQLAGLSSGKN